MCPLLEIYLGMQSCRSNYMLMHEKLHSNTQCSDCDPCATYKNDQRSKQDQELRSCSYVILLPLLHLHHPFQRHHRHLHRQ